MRLALAALCTLAAAPALASSDEAWEAFRTDVRDKCLAQQARFGSKGETGIEVNPFGSDRFGAAILTTTLAAGGTERVICIYDKQARTAELTAPFPEPAPADSAPATDPAAGPARSPADAAKAP